MVQEFSTLRLQKHVLYDLSVEIEDYSSVCHDL
jgi:hypothetical protein